MADERNSWSETSERVSASDPAHQETSSIEFAALWRIVRAGANTIIAVSVVCCVLATLVAFIVKPVFTSSASFIPPAVNNSSSLAAALAGQLSMLGGGTELGGKNPGELYSGILRSRSVAEEIVKRFDLIRRYKVKKESQAEKILETKTAVAVDLKSSIVTLSVADQDPAVAQQIANAFLDALRSTEGRLALTQSSQRRLFFDQQLLKEKNNLEDAEVELKKTEEQSGLIAPAGQTESEIKTIAEMQAGVVSREVQLAALRQSSTEENTDVIRLKSEIQDLQRQLTRLQNGSGKGTLSAIPTSKVPELQLDYVRKEREVKYHEALFEMLSKEYEAARLDEAHDAPMLQVLDPASLADTRTYPHRVYFTVGGLLFGLALGVAWVFVRRYMQAVRTTTAAQ